MEWSIMDLFTYLMNKNGNNVPGDLFSSLLGKGQSGTYQTFTSQLTTLKKVKWNYPLKGNTSQYSTTGKNLMPSPIYNSSDNKLTLKSLFSAGTYTISFDLTRLGTNEIFSSFGIFWKYSPMILD